MRMLDGGMGRRVGGLTTGAEFGRLGDPVYYELSAAEAPQG